jgi:plasmid stabilization system protein ParE
MRSVRFTETARSALDAQINYLISVDAFEPASRLAARVNHYAASMIARHPRAATFVPEKALWETWIPRTRFVVWYTFTDDEVVVINVWHTSQDRAVT